MRCFEGLYGTAKRPRCSQLFGAFKRSIPCPGLAERRSRIYRRRKVFNTKALWVDPGSAPS